MAALGALAGLTAGVSEVISTVATVAGTAVTAAGTIAAGKSAKRAADYEAAQLDIRAKEEQAAAQREAEQLRRRKEVALSTLTANAAASGFTATDPTALQIADDIENYGTMQEQMAMYGGQSRRVGTEAQAEGRRYEGRAALSGAKSKAMGTILGGVTTLADRYALRGRPQASGAASPYRYG